MPAISVSDNVQLTMTSGKKMQIVEWLSYHLHRNTFAEMKFIDERKKRFQVPWVHKSNRRWNENTASVFKAWAEYKGKEENFSFTRAKTNFRMAMKCQTNIREVPRERGAKRRHDDEMCVKVYEFIEPNDVKSKPKKTKVRRSSVASDCTSQDRSSHNSPVSLPSTSSQHQEDIPTVCTKDIFDVPPPQQQQESTLPFDHEILAAFASDTIPSSFEIKDFLPEDGDFMRLPSCQELLSRKPPSEELSKPFCDTRYIPLYESISDMEVPSSDNSNKVNCSPGGSSDDTLGDNFSLYDYTMWSQDLESHCQVANYTGSSLEYCFSDIETWEKMENALEQLFIRSFC